MKNEISSVTKRLLNLHEVQQMTGLAKPTVYRHIKKGSFPPPKKISTRRVGWLVSDIDGWLAGLQTTC